MKPRAEAPAAPVLPGEAAVLPADAVIVARVVGAWGVRGALRLAPFSASPEALFSSKRWYLTPGDGPSAVLGTASSRLLRIVQARDQGGSVVAIVDGLDDRQQAAALAGWRVAIARSSFPTPGADEFYWVDLIGCAVVNREGQSLGEVVSLVETGPHCVLRLSSTDTDGQQRLVPFVAAYVDTVDTAGRRIAVDWPLDF